MPTFSATTEVEVELHRVFEQISDEELIEEANRRCIEGAGIFVLDEHAPDLEQVYYDVLKLPTIPESLRQFLMRVTGRVL